MGMLCLIPEVRGMRPNRSAVNFKAVCWCLYHFISSTWSMTSEASFHRTTTWLVWYCACLTLQATANWRIFKSPYIINNDSLLFKQCVPLSALINDFWRFIFSHHSLCLWSFDLQTRFSFVSLVQNGLGAGWLFLLLIQLSGKEPMLQEALFPHHYFSACFLWIRLLEFCNFLHLGLLLVGL